MFDAPDRPVDIDVIACPETTVILLASVIEPLRAANRIAGRALYGWRIFSLDGKPVETTAGIGMPVDGAFNPGNEPNPLFIVSSYNWRRSNTTTMKMALSRAARHRSIIAGIESGTWLMAEASLLDNHRVTVHWEDQEDFSTRFPQIEVVKERFVIDRRRMTAAGALATLDLMLEIIRRRQGYSMALEVSRAFLYERGGGGAETGPAPSSVGLLDARLHQALRLMEETIDQPLTMEQVAARTRISARHLQTLFQNGLGVSPHEHYLALRLNGARRMVIETDLSLADAANRTGFNSASAFSRAYRAQFQESPSDTRRRQRG